MKPNWVKELLRDKQEVSHPVLPPIQTHRAYMSMTNLFHQGTSHNPLKPFEERKSGLENCELVFCNWRRMTTFKALQNVCRIRHELIFLLRAFFLWNWWQISLQGTLRYFMLASTVPFSFFLQDYMEWATKGTEMKSTELSDTYFYLETCKYTILGTKLALSFQNQSYFSRETK